MAQLATANKYQTKPFDSDAGNTLLAYLGGVPWDRDKPLQGVVQSR